MQICMLVQQEHRPIPDTIAVLGDYGSETIVDNDDVETQYRGYVMHLEGTEVAFVEWLKAFDGVWQCSSPMIGDWKVFHIKKELAL